MKKLVTMREALRDRHLLGDALPGDSWSAWRVLLIAACGEALTDAERVTFKALTGREREPGAMIETLLVVARRRSGKTKAMASEKPMQQQRPGHDRSEHRSGGDGLAAQLGQRLIAPAALRHSPRSAAPNRAPRRAFNYPCALVICHAARDCARVALFLQQHQQRGAHAWGTTRSLSTTKL